MLGRYADLMTRDDRIPTPEHSIPMVSAANSGIDVNEPTGVVLQ